MQDNQLFRFVERALFDLGPSGPLLSPHEKSHLMLNALDALRELRERGTQLPLFSPEKNPAEQALDASLVDHASLSE